MRTNILFRLPRRREGWPCVVFRGETVGLARGTGRERERERERERGRERERKETARGGERGRR